MEIFGKYPAISDKGDTFCDLLFVFLHTNPLLKKGTGLKEKNLLPMRAISFILQKGMLTLLAGLACLRIHLVWCLGNASSVWFKEYVIAIFHNIRGIYNMSRICPVVFSLVCVCGFIYGVCVVLIYSSSFLTFAPRNASAS